MKNFLAQFGFRVHHRASPVGSGAHSRAIVILIPLNLLWLGITLSVLIAISVVVTVRGRRPTGWIAATFAWRRRRKSAPEARRRPRSARR